MANITYTMPLSQMEGVMPDQSDWEAKAANILKAELKRQGVTYAQLAELIGDKEPNVRNKLSRGKFSAAYMLQCMAAIEVAEVRL
ncbi:DUF6471 domain-containing protein [Ascidiaceihabitans sp.]|uniref:DUF6471 domain-containing protein n=2 Tax=Ascidiaceihabitans sp. TaxID=1872644 RepID=UPI00329A0598